MNFNNEYEWIVQELKNILPKKIDDAYVDNRSKTIKGSNAASPEFAWALCGQDVSKLDLSELSREKFRRLSFDTNTKFSQEQIEKFEPFKLLEKGKQFGLNLELLHQAGITGKGVNVAMIDWNHNISNVEMLNTDGTTKVKLYDNSLVPDEQKLDDGFHGKVPAALLCGSTIGVAPESNLYFFAKERAAIEDYSKTEIILKKIKELNKNGANISIVSKSSDMPENFAKNYASDFEILSSRRLQANYSFEMQRSNYLDINNPSNFELENPPITKQEFEKGVNNVKQKYNELQLTIDTLKQKLEKSNSIQEIENIKSEIMLKEKEQNNLPKFVSTNYETIIDLYYKNKIYVPCGGRTIPQIGGGYKYDSTTCASWTIPQVAGLFALAKQLNPLLTFEEFTEISRETCHRNEQGYRVVNPEGIARQINEINKEKTETDERYKDIYSESQKLIDALDEVMKKQEIGTQKLGQETMQELNDTAYINETEMEMEQQEKYNNIDRKFTFNISEQDRSNIRNMLNEKIYEKSPYKDNTQVDIRNKLEYAQTTLYYSIGMLDYDMAFKNTNMIDYLHKRADYSSMLQVVEEEMVQLGISTSNKLQINKNIEGEIPGLTKKQNEPHFDNSIAEDRTTVKVYGDKELTIPSEIFHGTNEDFPKENIGKKDADGKYYIRDGVIYWAFEENTAKRYGNNISKHKFDENDKFICIDDTDGSIALRCQEELYEQSRAGTKYVICSNPHRSDVMDISNYADFVDTRDEKLAEKLIGLGELTKPFYDKNVSYSEYMEELEKAKKSKKDKEER